MVIVVAVAHKPVSGVKVYVVVLLLEIRGDQVPVIPLLEVVGKALSVAPSQTGSTWVKLGTTGGSMRIVIAAVVAHEPVVDGVKV